MSKNPRGTRSAARADRRERPIHVRCTPRDRLCVDVATEVLRGDALSHQVKAQSSAAATPVQQPTTGSRRWRRMASVNSVTSRSPSMRNALKFGLAVMRVTRWAGGEGNAVSRSTRYAFCIRPRTVRPRRPMIAIRREARVAEIENRTGAMRPRGPRHHLTNIFANAGRLRSD